MLCSLLLLLVSSSSSDPRLLLVLAAAASTKFPEFDPGAAASSQEQQQHSSMAWYPLPQAESKVSAGDEFFDTQNTGWSLWSSTAPDDRNAATAGVCSIKQERVIEAPPCSTGHSEEDQSAAPFEEPWFAHAGVDDIFLNQLFCDEEMRRMDDAPFKELDMSQDYMNTHLSAYENMLTGVLSGAEEDAGDHAKQMDRKGIVETVITDTCGLRNGSRDAGQSSNPEIPVAARPSSEEEQAGLQSMAKRSRAVTATESTPGFEAMVLEELEDVVFQLTRRTRIRYRDAFYRLAESSRACHSSSQQPDGNASSRLPPAPGCPERETNPIDRTVMALTMEAPRRQLRGSCCAGEDCRVEAAQSTTSWAA